MTIEKAELLAEQLIEIVDDYEGLGASEAASMKVDFIKVLANL
jgi:hypothetical protein